MLHGVEGDCESPAVELGDIVWFKPERITSGRRDVYIPMVGSARGAGFAIAWQEDPSGLRPGKGKGPGEGWSGAISNHKTDMWYTFISYDDFNIVDENFVSRRPRRRDRRRTHGRRGLPRQARPGPAQGAGALRAAGAHHRQRHGQHAHAQGRAEQQLRDAAGRHRSRSASPRWSTASFVPIDPEEIAKEFCGHPEADPATCCDPDNHEGDPNCEDLKGFFGNLTGTKRYAYMASTIDEVDNATGLYVPGGDGVPDYQYYVDRGGTLDLCDLSGANYSYMDVLPGTSAHERWFGFTNTAGASKLVCVASDGRLLDGDVYASRPMLQLQPYTKAATAPRAPGRCSPTRSPRAWATRWRPPSTRTPTIPWTRSSASNRRLGPGKADQAGHRQEHDVPQLRLHPARPGGSRPHRQPAGAVRRALPDLLRRPQDAGRDRDQPGEPDLHLRAGPAGPALLRLPGDRTTIPTTPDEWLPTRPSSCSTAPRSRAARASSSSRRQDGRHQDARRDHLQAGPGGPGPAGGRLHPPACARPEGHRATSGQPVHVRELRVHRLPGRDLHPAGLPQRRRRQAQRRRLQLQRLG